MTSYQSLARKYRPARFADVAGQEAVSQALANAIKLGREPHAVVFAGTRGIGKTTTARLYAKSLNCERGPTPDPCNVCESCLAIVKGTHEDVMEIDGASNTGVGDVRALQETIEYVPQRSKFKVYIIDEVHMLSQAAFNALLKTLEEPPSHVVFIFATTELGRVPQTIISRCQAFYLQKLSVGLIRQRVIEILGLEKIAFEDKAVSIIAREGHGSMRDALTLLDQAIALGGGQVTLKSLGALISNLSSSPYLDLLAAMTQRDCGAAMAVIATLDQSGVEFASAIEEAAKFARHGFVVRDLSSDALDRALLGLDDDEVRRLEAIAKAAPAFDLNRIFRTLCRCRIELDGSALDRYVVENYIFEWCLDPGLPDLVTLLNGATGNTGTGNGANALHDTRASVQPVTKSMPPDTYAQMAPPLPAQSPTPQPAAASQATPSSRGAPQRMRDVMAEIKNPQAAQRAPTPAVAAPIIQQPGPVTVNQVVQAMPIGVFPNSWRELVDTWKQRKPLQARKLEEVHPLVFSKTQITIAVSEAGFASKSLLQREEQLRVMEQFRELFGFTGQLTVVAKTLAENELKAADLLAETAMSEISPRPEISGTPEISGQPVVTVAPPLEAPRDDQPRPGATAGKETPMPDNLLKVKEREGAQRRQELIESARNAAFTQEVLAVFDASIEDVIIRE